MGRWRYLNFAVLLACVAFLYIGLFTLRSPLAPKPMGTVTYAERQAGPCPARIGHAAELPDGNRAKVQVRFAAGCTISLTRAGIALSNNQPVSLEAPTVGLVRGQPQRHSAAVPLSANLCDEHIRLWLGVQRPGGIETWTSWALAGTTRTAAGC